MRNVDVGGVSFKSYNSRNIYSIKLFYQIPQVFMKFTDQATKKSITNLMQLLNYNMQFSPED